jgi:hypothetical protein
MTPGRHNIAGIMCDIHDLLPVPIAEKKNQQKPAGNHHLMYIIHHTLLRCC